MNKIFNVIWNVMTQTWVVVSELTRTHTKRASATVETAVLATLLFATVQANATDEDEELDPVVRTAPVLSFHSDKEGTGEKEVTENSNWGIYFDNKGVLKAGAITLKAGDNLKIKQNTDESTNASSFTYSLKKDLTDLTSVATEKLSFGANGNKVDITSDANGLKLAKTGNGNGQNSNVHLNGIASTLTDTLAGGTTGHVDTNIDAVNYHRAASVQDVLNSGWNIQGNGNNVDFVRTYDTVDFVNGANANVSVTTNDYKKTTVRVDVTGLPVQYVTEDDKTVVKMGNEYYEAKQDGSADMAKKVENGELAKTKVKLVSVSGADPVKITNVAEGKDDNDAVSFKQLKALQDKQITLSTSNAYANGGKDADSGKATQTLSNGLNFKFKSSDGELLNISATSDTVTFTPKEGSVQVGDDGKATIQDGAKTTTGLVEASKLVDSLNKLGWKVGVEKDGTGATDGTHTDTLVKSGDKVTLKAGDNLKVKQEGTNFTYALKDELTGVKSVEFKDTANGANGASTKITKDGLTITLANGANGATVTDADKIKVASDGISAGNKAVKNVAAGEISATSTDAINGSQLYAVAKGVCWTSE